MKKTQNKASTKKQYIHITQGGFGVINENTNNNIRGIYTDNIKTCLGIVLYKKNGEINLFHYDYRQHPDKMKREFGDHQNIEKCDIYYNPYYESDLKTLSHMKFLEQISEIMGKRIDNGLLKETSKYEHGSFLCVNRDWKVSLNKIDSNPTILLQHPQEIHHAINMLNALLGCDDIDVQYNGITWSQNNKFQYSHDLFKSEEIFLEAIIEKEKANGRMESTMQEKKWSEEQYIEKLKEYFKDKASNYFKLIKEEINSNSDNLHQQQITQSEDGGMQEEVKNQDSDLARADIDNQHITHSVVLGGEGSESFSIIQEDSI